jgi:hypothetical protein
MAEQYDAAARNYREGEHFDELVKVITQHGSAMSSSLRERSRMAAQMHYFKVRFSGRLFPNTSNFFDLASRHPVSARVQSYWGSVF